MSFDLNDSGLDDALDVNISLSALDLSNTSEKPPSASPRRNGSRVHRDRNRSGDKAQTVNRQRVRARSRGRVKQQQTWQDPLAASLPINSRAIKALRNSHSQGSQRLFAGPSLPTDHVLPLQCPWTSLMS